MSVRTSSRKVFVETLTEALYGIELPPIEKLKAEQIKNCV